MSANPVLRALERAKLDAQLIMWERREAELTTAVARLLAVDRPLPKGVGDNEAIATFRGWCELNGVRCLPTQPATLAQFALEHAAVGIEELAETIAAISELHFVQGFPDPAATWIVAAAMQRVGDIPPPRSWPKNFKAQFSQLPYTVKKYVADHDAQREKVLRRAQNEAARSRRPLAKNEAAERTEKAETGDLNGKTES